MLTQQLEARVVRGTLSRKLKKCANCLVVCVLKNDNISVDEGTDSKEDESVGRKVDRHQRHQRYELVHIHKSPQWFHWRLSEWVKSSYRQHCEIEIATMRKIEEAAIAVPTFSNDYVKDGEKYSWEGSSTSSLLRVEGIRRLGSFERNERELSI